MKPIISERIIKPEQCAMAFGVPLTMEDFEIDQDLPNKGFARKFHRAWPRYHRDVVYYFDLVHPLLDELGVSLHPAATIGEFAGLFDGGFDVVILFSHWERDAVEFHDGLVDYREIAKRIPESFDGFIDLSVCHPDPLVTALKRSHPDRLIRSIKPDEEGEERVKKGERRKDELTPRYWLAFYHSLFTHLKVKDITYLDALEDTVISFTKRRCYL